MMPEGMPADLLLERQMDDAALLAWVPRLAEVTGFSEEQLAFAAGCARGSLGRRWVLSLIHSQDEHVSDLCNASTNLGSVEPLRLYGSAHGDGSGDGAAGAIREPARD